MALPSEHQRPRLAIVAPSAYLLGGVQTWLDYVVPGLEALGWWITILLVDGPNCNAKNYLLRHPFSHAQLVSNPTGSREGRIRALAGGIQSAKAQLVLAVNIADVYGAVARLRQAGHGYPKVAAALHGLQECFYHDIARWVTVIDGAIATNRLGVAATTRWGGLPIERVHYAPCGVALAESGPARSSEGELTLLYAGRFDAREKRVLDLPKILDALDRRNVQFRLRLAGAGPAEIELRNALSKYGSRVEFLGVLDEAAMRTTFFSQGAISLVLSPSETGPLVAFESLANGVALVTSRFIGSGLEGSLRDNVTSLSFPVGDTEAAAEAIERMTDPDFRLSVTQAGYDLVRARYSRTASINAWDDSLRKIWSQESLPVSQLVVEASREGRLDRFLGVRKAESLRRLLRLHFRHAGPGGEWPHSYGSSSDPDFSRQLADLDNRESLTRTNS